MLPVERPIRLLRRTDRGGGVVRLAVPDLRSPDLSGGLDTREAEYCLFIQYLRVDWVAAVALMGAPVSSSKDKPGAPFFPSPFGVAGSLRCR